ncbi:MAG: TetR/AcrR family transcriptional regulator [Bacteroidales bacterium]
MAIKTTEAEKNIIIAAQQVFYKKGYDGTKMRDIANVAQVNLSMLHYYYRSKDAIFKIVFDDAFRQLFKNIHEVLIAEVDFFKKVEMLVSTYIDAAAENPELPMFVMSEASKNSELLTEAMEKHKESNYTTVDLSVFFAEINKAIEDKLIKPINPQAFFIDLISLTILPYLSIGLLSPKLGNRKEMEELLLSRKSYISNMLINEIKL